MCRNPDESDRHVLEDRLAVEVSRAVLSLEVNAAIDFDGDSKRLAVEIKHELSDGVLPPEFQIEASAVA